jgi:Uma2 family endonuclease
MAGVMLDLTEVAEGRVVHLAEHPITFAELVARGEECWMELVDGVLTEKAMVQLDHELLQGWLFHILGLYATRCHLGLVVTSRILVEVGEFGGRMPDILFVRQERMDIVQKKAIYGAPDLIIEIVSPNDRPSDIIALETDYRSIAVAEILVIDQPKRRLRILRNRGDHYDTETLTEGTLRFETLGGITLQVEWLFQEQRPDELDLLASLLAQ